MPAAGAISAKPKMAPVSSEKPWWDTDLRKGKVRPQLESSVENPVVAYAKKKGVLVRKMNGLGFRGWPDRLFIFRNGVSVWIEFKAPGKKNNLSENQKEIIEALSDRDHTVFVVSDKEVGKAIIDEYLVRPT